MELKDYLEKKHISVEEFADLIEVERPTVTRYLLKTRKPDEAVMRKIYEVTFGTVQPNDFYDLPPLCPPINRSV